MIKKECCILKIRKTIALMSIEHLALVSKKIFPIFRISTACELVINVTSGITGYREKWHVLVYASLIKNKV